ncbi:hypothetical protein DB771_11700 [Burkholderia sp. AU29985]|nr:hypothetical protein EGY28_23755 [Burkholderia dolosa]PRE40100.1 hypothetical protein C6P87_29370 [Burkholderia sp. AU12872]PUA76694.1 hypothetical protein DB771_11700 [Burkholderia sp. AU29985]
MRCGATQLSSVQTKSDTSFDVSLSFFVREPKKWLGLLQRLLECVCTKGSRSRVQAVKLANAQHLSGRWSPQYSVVTSSGSACRAVWHAADKSLRCARC